MKLEIVKYYINPEDLDKMKHEIIDKYKLNPEDTTIVAINLDFINRDLNYRLLSYYNVDDMEGNSINLYLLIQLREDPETCSNCRYLNDDMQNYCNLNRILVKETYSCKLWNINIDKD